MRYPRNPLRGTALLRNVYVLGPSGEDCSAQPNKPFTIPAIPKPDHVCQDVIAASQAETNMRQLFILLALAFGLATTATATIVTTAVISDTNQVRGG